MKAFKKAQKVYPSKWSNLRFEQKFINLSNNMFSGFTKLIYFPKIICWDVLNSNNVYNQTNGNSHSLEIALILENLKCFEKGQARLPLLGFYINAR